MWSLRQQIFLLVTHDGVSCTSGASELSENVGVGPEEVHRREITAGLPTPTVPFSSSSPPPLRLLSLRSLPHVPLHVRAITPSTLCALDCLDLLIKSDSFPACPPREGRPAFRDLAAALKPVPGHTCSALPYVIRGARNGGK